MCSLSKIKNKIKQTYWAIHKVCCKNKRNESTRKVLAKQLDESASANAMKKRSELSHISVLFQKYNF